MQTFRSNLRDLISGWIATGELRSSSATAVYDALVDEVIHKPRHEQARALVAYLRSDAGRVHLDAAFKPPQYGALLRIIDRHRWEITPGEESRHRVSSFLAMDPDVKRELDEGDEPGLVAACDAVIFNLDNPLPKPPDFATLRVATALERIGATGHVSAFTHQTIPRWAKEFGWRPSADVVRIVLDRMAKPLPGDPKATETLKPGGRINWIPADPADPLGLARYEEAWEAIDARDDLQPGGARRLYRATAHDLQNRRTRPAASVVTGQFHHQDAYRQFA